MDMGSINDITYQFNEALKQNSVQLEAFAKIIFYYLTGIQLAVTTIWLAIKSDWMDFYGKMLQMMFTFSVFYTLINTGSVWMKELVEGFISIGSASSHTPSLTPGAIFDQGLSIASSVMHTMSLWGWLTNGVFPVLTVIVMLSIVILYALMAAELAIILIKSYTLISISGLMFAFGGNEAVRPIAINYFQALIGIGLQLLVFYLLMGVGMTIGADWSQSLAVAAQQKAIMPYFIVLGSVIIFFLILKNVPPFVASLSGVRGFNSFGSTAAMTAIMAASMGVKMATGGAGVVKGAAQGTDSVSRVIGRAGMNAAQSGSAGARKWFSSAFGSPSEGTRPGSAEYNQSVKDALASTSRPKPSHTGTGEDHPNYVPPPKKGKK